MITLTDICEELNNWFDTKEDGTKDRYFGTFTVSNGAVDFTDIEVKPGQYFRIIGSLYNDGVWQVPFPQAEEPVEEEPTTTTPTTDNTDDTQNTDSESDTGDTEPAETTTPVEEEPEEEEPVLIDEVFDGAIWLMRVPSQVMKLLDKINVWNDKYGPVVETPYNSETFGGYSYYKGYKNTASSITSWTGQFAGQLKKYRKLKNI